MPAVIHLPDQDIPGRHIPMNDPGFRKKVHTVRHLVANLTQADFSKIIYRFFFSSFGLKKKTDYSNGQLKKILTKLFRQQTKIFNNILNKIKLTMTNLFRVKSTISQNRFKIF